MCYDAVNATLLNQILKEHRKVEKLKQRLLRRTSCTRRAVHEQEQIEALTAGLQEVSDPTPIEQILTAKCPEEALSRHATEAKGRSRFTVCGCFTL